MLFFYWERGDSETFWQWPTCCGDLRHVESLHLLRVWHWAWKNFFGHKAEIFSFIWRSKRGKINGKVVNSWLSRNVVNQRRDATWIDAEEDGAKKNEWIKFDFRFRRAPPRTCPRFPQQSDPDRCPIHSKWWSGRCPRRKSRGTGRCSARAPSVGRGSGTIRGGTLSCF